eukprot:m.169402 g.169402  ORF g.169402 m.169402 type:complete len:139 (+) comp16475_c0_seq1:78-494(+)
MDLRAKRAGCGFSHRYLSFCFWLSGPFNFSITSGEQEEMKQRILAAEDALQALQAQYDKRPSRPDDVERIVWLDKRLTETQDKLKAMAAENERLNLEVVNREHTFNLMFKNSPIVQPAPPKGPRTRSARSRGSSTAKT